MGRARGEKKNKIDDKMAQWKAKKGERDEEKRIK